MTGSRDCDCPPAWAQVMIVIGSIAVAFMVAALCLLGVFVRILG